MKKARFGMMALMMLCLTVSVSNAKAEGKQPQPKTTTTSGGDGEVKWWYFQWLPYKQPCTPFVVKSITVLPKF